MNYIILDLLEMLSAGVLKSVAVGTLLDSLEFIFVFTPFYGNVFSQEF